MDGLSPLAQAQALADEASFDFAMGDEALALQKLAQAVALDPTNFAAWLAKAEVHFALRQWDEALRAGDSLENGCKRLVGMANEKGGHDNVTVILGRARPAGA